MAIAVRQLHPLFAGEVEGVDLRAVDDATFGEIQAAFDRYGVLVFHDQSLDEDQHIAFSERFGPLDINIGSVIRKGRMRFRPEFADISNVDEHSRILGADDRRRIFSHADRLWHTDASFKHVPAKYSLLYARVVPPTGGETEFVDLRSVYDALPEAQKTLLEGLVAEHSIFTSREKVGFTDFTADERAAIPPVRQVLTRTHPGTNRKTLYLASHASHIVGWPLGEGRALLHDLIEFATQPRFVHRHRWQPRDFVMWDDRCTMHRGRPYDDLTYRRDLRRTAVQDRANTVEQAQALAYDAGSTPWGRHSAQ